MNKTKLLNNRNFFFEEFTSREYSIFYSIIFLSIDYLENEYITISLKNIKTASTVEFNRFEEYIEILKSIGQKLKKTIPNIKFYINMDYNVLIIEVSESIKSLFTLESEKFTTENISIFNLLKSKYAKRLYRLLIICGEKNVCNLPINIFKEAMNIPLNYMFSDINKRVLNPALAELREHLNNLAVDKVKEGRSIVSLRFRWNTNIINPISF
ncbi:replication initiation protein [Veillonella sp. VA142]|uniref:replication initiation protein n=1 Tax=Veillonella sp. VA142 TaxID=741834 RepID=UPI000F8D1E9F|nr:replication initiation protein [Veillonella sp. VA142]